ncbi:helix-turn-helix domain-containing protein [Nonomuraea lactucae]|uniref:helix-turn-helix domain-containing protein n=1 Tax=Nonomuraea lactucae TaxID=2249762 RepID=UPI000DE38B2D|nr:helix-turn-helix transcriptional regulator [Nonomuraea lactucae]
MSNAERPSDVLARQVKYWRTRRKLSAQGLADRIAEDQGTLDRPAIFKIENGKRGVSVEEWLQLAYALAVPPALLFLDLAKGADVAVVPGAEVHPWLAWQWVNGEGEPVTTQRRGKRTAEWHEARRYVRTYEREVEASSAVHKAYSRLADAEFKGNAEEIQAAKGQQVEALRNLAAIFDEMVEQEMNPPGKPREWIEIMRNLNMLKYPDAVEIFEPDEEE